MSESTITIFAEADPSDQTDEESIFEGMMQRMLDLFDDDEQLKDGLASLTSHHLGQDAPADENDDEFFAGQAGIICRFLAYCSYHMLTQDVVGGSEGDDESSEGDDTEDMTPPAATPAPAGGSPLSAARKGLR